MSTAAPFAWMNDVSRQFLGRDILLAGETGEGRVAQIADAAARRLGRPEFAAKLYDYAGRGWLSFSSPIWSNFGRQKRGMPISCFGGYVPDSMEGIVQAHAEIAMMSKNGGGTSVYMGDVRPRGSPITDNGTSAGSVHFAEFYDLAIRIVSQGSSRRGECAGYWPIDHGDINEVLQIQTDGHPIKKMNFGVSVTDDWMRAMVGGDKAKREVWAKVLKLRRKIGLPYIFFVDTANRLAPEEYKLLNKKIHQSNLCTEIMLSNDLLETFVCCLLSANMYHYDEFIRTDLIEVLVYLLDAVMSEFIEKARGQYGYERAVRFAENQRALGLGQLGWHDYLQRNMIPFDAPEAFGLAGRVSKAIKEQAFAASAKMAAEYGEPAYLKGRGRRHMTLTAIAPTQSSSTILGQHSPGIEPHMANFCVMDKQKVKYTYQNPALLRLLAEKGLDTKAVIASIFEHQGSVQHLGELSDRERAVFKTYLEIDQMSLVRQAAARQPYVCQGQSLNLLFDPKLDIKVVNKVHVAAWELGLKSLYYQHNVSAAQQLTNSFDCAACSA